VAKISELPFFARLLQRIFQNIKTCFVKCNFPLLDGRANGAFQTKGNSPEQHNLFETLHLAAFGVWNNPCLSAFYCSDKNLTRI
jgi:hypothetical protein